MSSCPSVAFLDWVCILVPGKSRSVRPSPCRWMELHCLWIVSERLVIFYSLHHIIIVIIIIIIITTYFVFRLVHNPFTKTFLQIVRSVASSFTSQYLLFALRSFSCFLRLLPRLLIPPVIPSITVRRHFHVYMMWIIYIVTYAFPVSSNA